MKIYYHDQFNDRYAYDPAVEPGCLEPALARLKRHYPVIEIRAATKEEVLLVHSERHFENVAAALVGATEGETFDPDIYSAGNAPSTKAS